MKCTLYPWTQKKNEVYDYIQSLNMVLSYSKITEQKKGNADF